MTTENRFYEVSAGDECFGAYVAMPAVAMVASAAGTRQGKLPSEDRRIRSALGDCTSEEDGQAGARRVSPNGPA